MSRPLRIAHIDTERTWRGGQQQVEWLIQGLRKRGHVNFAVVRTGSALSQRLRSEDAQRINVNPWGEFNFIDAHFLRRRFLQDRIDVVHAHSGHGVALGALSTLRTAIPFVVTRRVDFPVSNHALSRWKYGRADRVIAISQGVRNVLQASGLSPEKLEVVPSGVPPERYKGVVPLSRSELGVPKDAIVVGQVAALAPHKDQWTLLHAMARLKPTFPHVILLIVGEGKLRNQLEEEIRRLNLKETVRLVGFKENPLDYLASFDFFCLSSKEEGLGTSIIDAMALRVPVIATRAGGIPELVEDGVTGFLSDPQNPQALAQALARAFRSGSKIFEIREKAYQKALSFSIVHTVSKTEQVYLSLLQNDKTS